MRIPSLAICLIAGSLLAPAFALAEAPGSSDRDHPKEFVKDSAITTKIKAKLATEQLSSLAKIHVDTDKSGAVWLSGTARTEEAAERAVAIAKATEHVTSVHSDIRVKKED